MIILMSSFQFQYVHVNVILMSNMKQWLLKLKLNFDNGAIDRRRLIRTFSACYGWDPLTLGNGMARIATCDRPPRKWSSLIEVILREDIWSSLAHFPLHCPARVLLRPFRPRILATVANVGRRRGGRGCWSSSSLPPS